MKIVHIGVHHIRDPGKSAASGNTHSNIHQKNERKESHEEQDI
jgi:hypothetical protein